MFFESNELLELNEYLNYVNSLKKVSNKDLEILLENLNEENKKRNFYEKSSKLYVNFTMILYT